MTTKDETKYKSYQCIDYIRKAKPYKYPRSNRCRKRRRKEVIS